MKTYRLLLPASLVAMATLGHLSASAQHNRVYHKEQFQVVDTTAFYLYYQNKNVVPVGGKGMYRANLYFFSTAADSPIIPLTIENLKKAYPASTAFHYALDAYFNSDRQLMSYDEYAKMYKLKYLFLQTLVAVNNPTSDRTTSYNNF
ncbi:MULTISPECIES: hypothetical protein [Niastella]|uniref:Uncharacterized protein n=1 Tax=Niastella soli TaxID=2821487 RepID=A0ABS3YNX8_9BACT|nr:hypothetical protein [Niastella soli]MBO9199580.1 hypothetical protein [Niastella soli]